MTLIECSLCQQPFDVDDALISERVEKHEAKHHRYEGLPSQRDGHKTQNSSAKGDVEWYTFD